MKKTSKALLLSLCAVLLVAASVLGTMAYLTSADEVTNTFTVGKVAITLDEAKTDINGVAVKPAERVDANTYKLLPGHTYTKDPTVYVDAKSEDAYVRMLVTVNKHSELKTALPEYVAGNVFMLQNLVSDWDQEVWYCNGVTENADNTATYEFRYVVGTPDKLEDGKGLSSVPVVSGTGDLPALFTSITLPGSVTNAQLDTLEGLSIDVVAQAIQADGFANADAAWAAFAK